MVSRRVGSDYDERVLRGCGTEDGELSTRGMGGSWCMKIKKRYRKKNMKVTFVV